MIQNQMIPFPENDWLSFFQKEEKELYFQELMCFVAEEYQNKIIYPPVEKLFSAFHLTPVGNVKVVILGQDPYHNEHQAHGLAFSVEMDCKLPPSLKNIFQELNTDLGIEPCRHGNLTKWAKQGVLLINTVLTVREHEPNSHKNQGWEIFTDHVISYLNGLNQPIVFVLWGSPSIKKKKLLTNPMHMILESPHPSPLSSYRGFFGSKPFSKINQYLTEQKINEIDWNLN